jgi:hypothetical protein
MTVDCGRCGGTGWLHQHDGEGPTQKACPGPHVVLEIPFADPDKLMWWCAINKSIHSAASDEPDWCSRWEPHMNPDHVDAGCGWVAKPAATWREADV